VAKPFSQPFALDHDFSAHDRHRMAVGLTTEMRAPLAITSSLAGFTSARRET
jgi:hypothetical protein